MNRSGMNRSGMNRWVKIGAAVLLLAWAPFLYAELTSDPLEKKGRNLPDDVEADPGAEVVVAAAEHAEHDEHDEHDEHAEPAAEGEDKIPAPNPSAPRGTEDDPGVEPEAAEVLAEPDNEPSGVAAPAVEATPPSAQGPVEQLKAAFDSEPRDALWAKDSEAKISAMLSGSDVPDSLLERVACQKTVCRIDLRWTPETSAPYLDNVEELQKSFDGQHALEPHSPVDKDGVKTLGVHMYVMRSGYTLEDVAK